MEVKLLVYRMQMACSCFAQAEFRDLHGDVIMKQTRLLYIESEGSENGALLICQPATTPLLLLSNIY